MSSSDRHYGHADRVNRWARGAMAFVVLIAIGAAVIVSGRGGDETAAEVLASRAGSFTVSPVTLVSRGDLGIPESTTATTPTTRDTLPAVEDTVATTSTSLGIAIVASQHTTPTTPAPTPIQSTTTRPPTTTTSTTTTLPATTTTSSTTTTIPNPDVSIFLRELRASSASSGDGWEATVRVTIDATKGGVDLRFIMVTGAWTGALDADVSGQTNRQGRVTFNTPLLTSGEFFAFRVKSIFHPEYFYDSGLNQADSAITITRRSEHPVQLARLFR